MVIKVYTSGISGNKEVKKKQQRIMMILESKNYEYVAIDITEPGKEEEKFFMQENAKPKPFEKYPIPPQIFNESEYCGDYEGFDVANENDELEIFLKMPLPPPPPVVNGNHEHSTEKDTSDSQVPERQEELINSMVPETADDEPVKELNDVNEEDKKEQEDETESLENEEMDAEEEEDKGEEAEDENKDSDEDIEEEE